MLLYWVWFAQLNKLTTLQKQQLLQRFRDPEELYHCDGRLQGLSETAMDALEDKDLTIAQGILADCEKKGIGILTLEDASYPMRLRNTADAPLVLYYKGKLPNWEKQPVIGIVGTRRASSYGLNMAVRFGRQIAACGALVISGGAAGIDSAAMKGALEAGRPTVAVLGCGVDVVYPRENKFLFAQTQETGCLLSEYPPGTKGIPWHFPARNRIISGISNGLLVVEAPEKSGALITANHALEQGREVFVVPGNLDMPSCAGSNALLQDRAMPALSGWDVVKDYAAIWPGALTRQPEVKVAQTPKTIESAPVSDKKAIDKEEKSTYSVLNSKNAALSETEQTILALIGREPVPMDEVIGKTDMSASAVKTILTKLTVKGLLAMHPGGRISLK